jgi:hypothetical protein
MTSTVVSIVLPLGQLTIKRADDWMESADVLVSYISGHDVTES